MPYDPELGMRVYDPREGAQQGLQIGNAFNQAFQSAQNRKLSERQIALAEQEAKDKAGSLLRRQIGLKQMQDDVQQLTATGVDPMVARKTALVNNAHLIFADHPDAIQRLVTSEEANDVRAQATKMLNDYREQNLLRMRQHDEALAEHRAALDDERTRHNMTAEQLMAERNLNTINQAQNNLLKIQLDTQSKQADRALKASEGAANRLLKATKDTTLQKIDADLVKKHQELQDKLTSPRWHWMTDREGLTAAIADLESQRAKRMKELGISEEQPEAKPEPTETPTAKPAPKQGQPMRLGTMIEQDGKKYRYQGGDVNDPASYVEVK